jgi:hypothetical protein
MTLDQMAWGDGGLLKRDAYSISPRSPPDRPSVWNCFPPTCRMKRGFKVEAAKIPNFPICVGAMGPTWGEPPAPWLKVKPLVV